MSRSFSSHAKAIVDTLLEKRRLQAKYKTLFGTPEGEAVLQHLCKTFHVYRSSFVAGDPYATALNEGSRRVVLSILQFLGRDLSKMIQQAEEQRSNEDTL